jgi:predicted nuclease of predicted toxin-antitoxin system
MRFLVDNALSPVLATLLAQAGHDALHVRTIELHGAEDVVIFELAATDDRIVAFTNGCSRRSVTVCCT